MEVMSHSIFSSTLNPNAPMFVPSAYREVEDFSDQWWDLVQSTPWFRDYWLQECFSDSDPQNQQEDYDSVLFDTLFGNDGDDDYKAADDCEEREVQKDLIPLGVLKWRKSRAAAETPRYYEKVPKIVNVKARPRPIQQPR